MSGAGILRLDDTVEVPCYSLGGGRVALEIDLSVFSLDAVLSASYKFTDRCHVFLTTASATNHAVFAVIAPKDEQDALPAIIGEFSNELIDQQLRERLEVEFGPVRTLLVAQAFSEGNLLDEDRDHGDPRVDPKSIARRR